MATVDRPPAAVRRRTRMRVVGTVQGVGFRPYVYRLAHELGLAGFVRNDERGVLVEVEGDGPAVALFGERLAAEAPPLARVEGVIAEELGPAGERGFRIAASTSRGRPDAPVPPDGATCDACLAELFDPADRRFRYPFLNCTDCGPRFTIVRGVPYDRRLTTMTGFEMCARCRAEYEDPHDRRFHAQPNACPDCGPSLRIAGREAGDPLRAAVDAIAAGLIVAVKGIGGFHLACRAGDEWSVGALRARKHREDRPFAVMVRDLAQARLLAELSEADEHALAGPARPIVIARARRGAPVAPSVAPRSRDLGLMLPYSPLHHLLVADAGEPLVMTSGNVSDEPIAYEDADALERLRGIADLFLLHDRPIETRTDDSVLRGPLVVRRSRGYVPAALGLPVAARRPLLACGAELKSTFCVAKGGRAWLSHHVGDLGNYETLRSFRTGIDHFKRLFAVEPELVAHDLHPDYLSTGYARELEGVAHVGVQHHHAHLAACLAEHGERGPAVGAIYDGAGHGLDGAVWGGELLVGGLERFERAGHLRPVRLPGGDRAVREPWRMACAWLAEIGAGEQPLPGVDAAAWRAVRHMARTGAAAPITTSAGRLFDAVAALAGLRTVVTYEGQAAVELEAGCDLAARGAYRIALDGLVLDPRDAVAAVVRDCAAGAPAGAVSARFHRGLAWATADACEAIARERAIETVVLSGGVFQNRVLLALTTAELERRGLRVLVPRLLPPNDGGIAFGQAAVAAATDGVDVRA
jgi:hydrogenase maturation protein HypF